MVLWELAGGRKCQRHLLQRHQRQRLYTRAKAASHVNQSKDVSLLLYYNGFLRQRHWYSVPSSSIPLKAPLVGSSQQKDLELCGSPLLHSWN